MLAHLGAMLAHLGAMGLCSPFLTPMLAHVGLCWSGARNVFRFRLAAHKGHRRSVSSGIVCFQGCLLLATSRTQRVVALSSAEAEVHAAVSTTCDGLLLRV